LSALAIIKEAIDCGVSVSLNGDKVTVKASARPSPELLAKLREHKGEIVALLRKTALSPEPAEAEVEYRKGMASGGVPEAYLDAWARLQVQKPETVSDAEWRRAVNDAGLFLDAWGGLALESQWTPGDLFDVPRDGRQGGLAWFLKSEVVRALGPEHAVTESGRVFDRLPLG
jgi:hypothetical protein